MSRQWKRWSYWKHLWNKPKLSRDKETNFKILISLWGLLPNALVSNQSRALPSTAWQQIFAPAAQLNTYLRKMLPRPRPRPLPANNYKSVQRRRHGRIFGFSESFHHFASNWKPFAEREQAKGQWTTGRKTQGTRRMPKEDYLINFY